MYMQFTHPTDSEAKIKASFLHAITLLLFEPELHACCYYGINFLT